MILTKSANYIASLFNLFLPSPSELYIHIIVEYFHIMYKLGDILEYVIDVVEGETNI